MGLTYSPINLDGTPFDVNSAGASILAMIYEKAKLPLIRDSRIPFIASSSEVEFMLGELSQLPADAIKSLQNDCIQFGLLSPDSTIKEFLNEWMDFLKTSGGYTCE